MRSWSALPLSQPSPAAGDEAFEGWRRASSGSGDPPELQGLHPADCRQQDVEKGIYDCGASRSCGIGIGIRIRIRIRLRGMFAAAAQANEQKSRRNSQSFPSFLEEKPGTETALSGTSHP